MYRLIPLATVGVQLYVLAAAALSAPSVILDNGTFTGGYGPQGMIKFLGIPFALPPTGDLRYRLPVANYPYNSTRAASEYGPACYQQALNIAGDSSIVADLINQAVKTVFDATTPSSEDCLSVNVWMPSNVPAGIKLPVVFWMFGGGYQFGSTSSYNGESIVARSVALGTPIVYVSANYRLNALGFLSSKEVKAAKVGNLGLRDQRLAMQWIQKYIGAFSGDRTKVTIWGESAGSQSAAMHMLIDGGNPGGLFRAAFMESGSPLPASDITVAQPAYDQLVIDAGCGGSQDTLECLRTVPYAKLTAAIDKSPSLIAASSPAGRRAWVAHIDGDLLVKNPQQLVAEGSVARIPIVNGDCDDEGTFFSLGSSAYPNDAGFSTFVAQTFPGVTPAEIASVMAAYPSDPTQGSPYGTGYLNILSQEFKRIASFQGDFIFQAPRRFFLENIADKQPVWTYTYRRNKALPFLGSFHGSDILNVYGNGEMADHLINFAVSLDPSPSWPKWTNASRDMLLYSDDILAPISYIKDTYRLGPLNLVKQLSLLYPPL